MNSSRTAGAAGSLPQGPPSSGRFIVLLGPDGSGKSTVAHELIRVVDELFKPRPCLHVHWKPSVVHWRRTKGTEPVVDPHGAPPRGKLLSLAFFCFHWLDFVLGSCLRISPVIRRGGFVLVERHYYDFFVDPRRYRLNIPEWLIRCGAWFLRKPDLVVLLDADPKTLQSRKREVPLEETARQREAYLTLMGRFPRGMVVDATRPVDSVVSEIKAALFSRENGGPVAGSGGE